MTPTSEAREMQWTGLEHIHDMLFSVVFASPEERYMAYQRIATALRDKDQRIAALEEGLRPFAAIGATLNKFKREWLDDDTLWCTEDDAIKAGHCRRANELLSGEWKKELAGGVLTSTEEAESIFGPKEKP